MTDLINLKSKALDLPQLPGVYLFKNGDGVVIYVGKAKSLKSRVLQYFGNHDTRPQLPFLMAEAQDLDYVVVNSELESLFLENTLIKQYMPVYNIKLRDDKNYAFISINYHSQIPTIGYSRKVEDSSIKYFGPYSSARKIKQTLDFIRTIFPYCSHDKVGKRPCFYYHLHRCPGVCIGLMSLSDYKVYLDKIVLFLSGKTGQVIKELKGQMEMAARAKKFERAAGLRDQIRNLEMLGVKQIAAFPNVANWDFVSAYEFGTNACVNLFKVREGKLIDKDIFIYDTYSGSQGGTDATTTVPEVIQRFCERYYSDTSDVPQAIFTQVDLINPVLFNELLESRSKRVVKVSVPERGEKLALIKLGETNAQEALQKWHHSQASNADVLKQALTTLKDILQLPTLPHRIECYDMSNTQGTNPVGSMVVFQDGLPVKSEYRKFKIRVKDTPDDFAMMTETLARRLARIVSPPREGETEGVIGEMNNLGSFNKIIDSQSSLRPPLPPRRDPPHEEGNNTRKWDRPDLLVIDGGKGQLGVAVEVLDALKLDIPVIGLAKRIEEIFLPHNPEPIVLPHDNPTLQLLQRLRDEAHRFGITFHRSLRSKQAVKSALDTISGIGPKTKKLLKTKFGTVAEIRKASFEALEAVVGKQKAEIIKKHL